MRRLPARCLTGLLVTLLLLVSCEPKPNELLHAAGDEQAAANLEPSGAPGEQPADPPPVDKPSYETRPGEPQAVITELETMRQLEDAGFSLGERLGADGKLTLQELSRHPAFGSISRVIEHDLEEFRQKDPKLGVGVSGNPHRLFDPGWLRSADARFELVGVISRLDRRPFVEDACGEIRLVYRMSYDTEVDGQRVASRLPLTLALDWLDLAPQDGSCQGAARRWHVPAGLTGERLADWLTSDDGPLDTERMTPDALDRVLLNMQSVRWPSTVHPGLGGHAEYVLRSFEPGDDGRFVPEPLENTPDVDRLAKNARLRRELIRWIEEPENLRRIDEGTALLPEKFLAKRAVSAAPRGLARKSNRPFLQVLSEDAFSDVDFSELRQVRSPAGLVRRLDDHSCAGCHQGRAVAGFHMLGEDPEETVAANALAVGLSAHAAEEERRRVALLRAEADADAGAADYSRPFSERDADEPGAWGTPCGLTDDATFSEWDCADGLVCIPYDTPKDAPHIGVCAPKEPQVGDPCEVGRVRSQKKPADDRIYGVKSRACPDGAVCNRNKVGFPGGMCTTGCDDAGEQGRCGAIAVLKTFNRCLARNTPFDKCLSRHVNPAGLRACDADNACRHDYLCAKNADGEGVCIPPYFLFQMRVDGHPEAG